MKLNKRTAFAGLFLAVGIPSGVISGIAYAGPTHTGYTHAEAPAHTDYNSAVNSAGYKQAGGIAMHVPTRAESRKNVTSQPLKTLGGGGCTIGYGRGKQCLPINPPNAIAMEMTVSQMPWTCSQVKALFPQGIRVNNPKTQNADPSNLDSNHDGIACNQGDK